MQGKKAHEKKKERIVIVANQNLLQNQIILKFEHTHTAAEELFL